jgi:hypothetical protein
MTNLVICNKAGFCDYCKKGCIHSEPHEIDYDKASNNKCTTWGECNLEEFGLGTIKVRCVKVKEQK